MTRAGTRHARTPRPAEPVRALVEDLDDGGRGVARVGGKVTFVEGALPGEEVSARVRRRRTRYDEAETEAVVRASPDRVAPRCPHFGRCGGCVLQHLALDAQVRAKEAGLLANLRTVAGLAPGRVLDPIAGPPWGYRRKARLGVKDVPGKGGVLVGFRERHGPKLAVLDACEVLVPAVGRRIAALRALVDGLDARRRIPQIEVAGGDDAVALVFRHLDPLSDRDREPLAAFGAEGGIQVHLQPGGPASVAPLAPATPPPLAYRLPAHEVELAFGPMDFVQVNAAVNRALVARALALLDASPGEEVLDLFCGIGNFTLPIARTGARVTGLEGDAGLVARARANAAANAVPGARFEAVDLADAAAVEGWLGRAWDAVLLDPPRSGALEVVERIGDARPARVVYVSCNPGTLARDAAVLVGRHRYRLAAAGAVDMFPHTGHVESVALFEAG